ncbi:MAG: methylmalonyl-CoA mutase family protein, partial [Cyclonatronaceae bacterium]
MNSSRIFELPSYSEWKALAEKGLKGAGLESLAFETSEGITLKPLYTAEDAQASPYINSMPGLPPYTRGPYPTMYTQRPWTIRQYA